MDFKNLIDANGHAEIPEGTDKIPQRAFKECKTLKSVTIPASVSAIQTNAFEKCESLTSIVIPDSVKRIGRDCFKDCKNLTEVKLPQGITMIDYGLFRGCEGLNKIVIPESVTSIGDRVFSGCSSLTNVVLPNNLTSLGVESESANYWGEEGVFYRCSKLTTITLPDRLESIGFRCFDECKSLNSVIFPSRLKVISSFAFDGCSKLESISLPDSLEIIGTDAFLGCPLTSVSLPPRIKKLSGFCDCTGLTNIIIPDSVTIIGSKAFSGCKGLVSITIPDSVTEIGFEAFGGCTGLSSITIPDSVTEIGSRAFINCKGLVSITIPDSVKEIKNGTFSGCSSLRTIGLPKVMNNIGSVAFRDCSVLEYIEIPEGVSEIPQDAFAGCRSVHIHLSSTVTGFKKTWDLIEAKEISISADNKALSVENDCVVDQKSRSVIIILPSATSFPQNIRSIKLAKDAFPNLYDVEELVIPEGVSYVDNLPFEEMTKLKKLQLPKSMNSCGYDFMDHCPLQSVAVSPELFLSDNFKAWQDINIINLIGIDSISDELLDRIKNKYKNQKDGLSTKWGGREGAGRLFWVYFNGQLIYPAAHIVKKKEEAIAAQLKKEEEERLNSKKKEMSDKLEDITISSLCAATFGNNGFEFGYRNYENTVKVIIFGNIKLEYSLNINNVQEDLVFLLDVATRYRDALKLYIEQSPTPLADIRMSGLPDSVYCVCGTPFSKTNVYLSVQSETLSIAFAALEDLAKAYRDLSQKYGEKFNQISYNVWW